MSGTSTITFKDSSEAQNGLLICPDIDAMGDVVINIESGNYQFEDIDSMGCSIGILTIKGGTINMNPECIPYWGKKGGYSY